MSRDADRLKAMPLQGGQGSTRTGPARRIGLISDTHGLLRPEALDFLSGCEHIVHAGDIGGQHVLDALGALAPVTAVRGNNDGAAWARTLPAKQVVRLEGACLLVLHDLADLDLVPADEGVDVVICGHSHQPRIERRDGVIFVNPGSAGPRRFTLPVTAAELIVSDEAIVPRIVEIVARPG